LSKPESALRTDDLIAAKPAFALTAPDQTDNY